MHRTPAAPPRRGSLAEPRSGGVEPRESFEQCNRIVDVIQKCWAVAPERIQYRPFPYYCCRSCSCKRLKRVPLNENPIELSESHYNSRVEPIKKVAVLDESWQGNQEAAVVRISVSNTSTNSFPYRKTKTNIAISFDSASTAIDYSQFEVALSVAGHTVC